MVRRLRSVHIELPGRNGELRVATGRNKSGDIWPPEGGRYVDVIMADGARIIYGLWAPGSENGRTHLVWKQLVCMENGVVLLNGIKRLRPLVGDRDGIGIKIRPSLFSHIER